MTNPRIWFITGASAGFGRAYAEHALSKGDSVVVTARRTDRLEAIAATAPDRVLAVPMDVTEMAQIEAAVAAAIERFGRIDVLVNNAGYGTVGAVEEFDDDALRAQMETNFFGAAAVTRTVLPHMRAARSGAIVMMSSMGGQMSFAGFGPYSASKFALEGLTEALAQEVAPFGIRTLIVEPGAFRTEFAGPSAMTAVPGMDAYADVVGGTRDFAAGMDGTQEGDPAKAAAAVDAALQADVPPLRLALGDDAVDAVREPSEAVLAELRQWEGVGRDTRLDQSAA